MSITVEVIDPGDAAADRAAATLLARPMDGAIRLALTRNPSPLGSAELVDRPPRLILAREGDRPVGMAITWRRPAFLDGAEAEVRYLGQLRLERPLGRGPLARGFDLALADTNRVALTLTTIARDNHRARRLLERGLRGVPTYHPIGDIATLAFPTRRGHASHVRPATSRDLPALRDLLDQQRHHHSLCPRWPSIPTLKSPLSDRPSDPNGSPIPDPGSPSRDLTLDDFLVADEGSRLVGACALWDQRRFKQTVIVGYTRLLRVLRPVSNALARVIGRAGLPTPGTVVPLAFLSHFVAPNPSVARDLVRSAMRAARPRGIEWLSLSLAASDPLLPALAHLPHRRYATRLYAVGEVERSLISAITAGFRLEGALL